MSKTFTSGGYSVTVHDDRSIKVQPDDWISKYAQAIYGDPLKNWHKFKRKVGWMYADIENYDQIKAGETLYHPDPLPGEVLIGPGTGIPEPMPPLKSKHAATFLDWLIRRFVLTDWKVTGTAGGDLSVIFFTAQYAQFGITQITTGKQSWFHALATGATVGWPSEGFTLGGSFSTTQCPSAGSIMRSPLRQSLTIDDFRHGIIVLEYGANFVYFVGGSLAIVLFGVAAPVVVLAEIFHFFRYGNMQSLKNAFQKAAPSGLALFLGGTIGMPGFSVAARAGFMYDRAYFGI